MAYFKTGVGVGGGGGVLVVANKVGNNVVLVWLKTKLEACLCRFSLVKQLFVQKRIKRYRSVVLSFKSKDKDIWYRMKTVSSCQTNRDLTCIEVNPL